MTSVEQIPNAGQTLEERGIPSDSYFEVVFKDGSAVSEKDVNWSSFAELKSVDYFGLKRAVYISNYPISSITINYSGLTASIEDIPDGVDVYQFIRSSRLLARSINKNSIIGRGIGLVKDGVVIEERFINEYENRVQGLKL